MKRAFSDCVEHSQIMDLSREANFLSLQAGSIFRNIFILESRSQYEEILKFYDASLDLVLTYDFAVSNEVKKNRGTVFYADHLCTQEEMQENNFLAYKFFAKWHLDNNKNDLFCFEGIDFGHIFNIHIWNDLTFYARTWMCLSKLRGVQYESLWVGGELTIITSVLADLEIEYKLLDSVGVSQYPKYYFPIHKWMDERLRSYGVREFFRDIIVPTHGLLMGWFDKATEKFFPKKRIFIQEYYPTRDLLTRLQKDGDYRILQGHFSLNKSLFKFFKDRPIPIYGRISQYKNLTENLFSNFQQMRIARLKLSTGDDISAGVYRLIDVRVKEILPEILRNLNCVIKYLSQHPISLVVLIGNIGHTAMLVDCVAKKEIVPRYLIINGLMLCDYLDEAKDASVINAYSESIKKNYFKGMDNVVCLGDPRMDQYSKCEIKAINHVNPTITIGSSGFSNIDLNSYLAVEFEFLNDVLMAIRETFENQLLPKLILKVRSNGYKKLYSDFIGEYFPELICQIDDSSSMKQLLEGTDLYISIFSQSVLEASALGIPCIYHKNDIQILHPPFDGNSELVTTVNRIELQNAIIDFKDNTGRFSGFLSQEVLEKYIGPLDGGNLERNLEFIERLLQ